VNAPAPSTAAQDASDLAALIREQSATEIAQLLADAHARAERVRAAATAELESTRAAAARAGEERGRRRAAALLAVAEAQSRLKLLQVRESHIDEARGRARTQLCALSGVPNPREVVAAFVREALRTLDPGPVRVRLPGALAALLDDATRRHLGAGRWALHFETAAVPGGGVIVETDDGHRRFDNSIAARFRRRAPNLRQLAAQLLWPPAESESGT
jgi:vacuolar-type H+-ATPase subunit E/Vma4